MIVGYGWGAFATITERPGMNGSMYLYYDLTKLQYVGYNMLISIAGFYMICCVALYLIKKDTIKLTKTFWRFLILMILIIVCEFYLQIRFIGKGG
jgi:hypothetical protein